MESRNQQFRVGDTILCISSVDTNLYHSSYDGFPNVGMTYNVLRSFIGASRQELLTISLNESHHNYFAQHFELVSRPGVNDDMSSYVASIVKSRKQKK